MTFLNCGNAPSEVSSSIGDESASLRAPVNWSSILLPFTNVVISKLAESIENDSENVKLIPDCLQKVQSTSLTG